MVRGDKIKVLNLYAGIGGNRKLWPEQVEVTAVEIKPDVAKVYSVLFPNDKVVVGDAHEYLLKHFKEFDFVWSSPPCPTHSVTNNFLHAQGIVRYPDMKLYEEIIFLKTWFKGCFCVENVKSYYPPLISAVEIDRHYFWANFYIPPFKIKRAFNIANARASTRQSPEEHEHNLEKYLGINLSGISLKNKRLALRNCVHPEIGLHIFNAGFNGRQSKLIGDKKGQSAPFYSMSKPCKGNSNTIGDLDVFKDFDTEMEK